MAYTSPISVPNLRKELAKLEEAAAHIRFVLAMAGEAEAESAEARADQTMRDALGLDAQRRGNGKQRHRRGEWKALCQARRERTATALAKFTKARPQPLPRNLASLATHGYLKKKGDGYVRTSKVFTP